MDASKTSGVPRGEETSGLSIIQVTDNGFLGGADPLRHDGTASGRVGGGTESPSTPPMMDTSTATYRTPLLIVGMMALFLVTVV